MKRALRLVVSPCLLIFSCCALTTLPTRAQALDTSLNEQVLMLPVMLGGKPLQLETTVYKPSGQGPFPLLLMNHGKERGNPAVQKRDRFLVMAREFVRRGYVVAVPMRRGFSRSMGDYNEYGCNMHDNGMVQADDVEAALRSLIRMPWVDRDRIVVAGQSYGGLATLAFGTRPFPGVRGLLNFAGGLRIDDYRCDWRSALVSTFARYGSRTALPSLWFYGDNDSYFDHSLAHSLQSAYRSAGGSSRLIAYGRFKSDAHGLVASRDGVAVWWPETENFLRRVGMPTEVCVVLAETPRLPASHFATIDDLMVLPLREEAVRQAYQHYLTRPMPRAFALSDSGAWSWAEDGDDPASRALDACQRNSKTPCRLYSVDQDVVWNPSARSGLTSGAMH